MNRETRTFIWGLIVLLICSTAMATQIFIIINNGFEFGWHWLFFIISLTGTIFGAIKIGQTTD